MSQEYDTTSWPDWGIQLLHEIRDIKKGMGSINTTMEEIKADISTVKQTANIAIKKVSALDETVQNLKQENQILKDKIVNLELYSRKNSLIFFNLYKSKKETTHLLYRKLSDELAKVGLCLDDLPLDNIHRLPKSEGSSKPRPVIVKFVSFIDRESVWDCRFELKSHGCNLFIKEHIPAEIESKIKKLEPIRQAAKDQGMKAKITGDRLVINSKSYTVDTLQQLPVSLLPENIAVKETEDYVFFYSGATCLSNFHPAVFTHNEHTFHSTEQFLHHAKALHFGDEETAKKIMDADTPAKCKHLGHTVKNFSKEEWQKCAFDIMVDGLQVKFEQNQNMAQFLISTQAKILVEAAPRDTFWGIGKGLYDKKLMNNPSSWGKNLLGKALEVVRGRINS